MVRHKRLKTHLVYCLHLRELGLHINQQDNLLKSFVEEKASLPNRNQPCEVSGQTRSTVLMEFSPDGKRIASTHGDHSIRVTDMRTGRCTHTLTGHPRTPWCIAFHPSNNDILGSGCLGGEVRIWDLQGGGSEVWHSDDTLSIASLTFHPSDNVVVFAVSNKLHFWDWTRSEPFAICETAQDFEKIRWVKFDCVGHRLLTAIANDTDEAFSDISSFPLFSDCSTNNSRFNSGGAVDVAQLLENVGPFPQMRRISTNDDSLMDLRTGWSGNRNDAVDLARSSSSAHQYACNVTTRAYRSSVNNGSIFSSSAAHSLRHAGLEGRYGSQQIATSSSDLRLVSLSARGGPLLSSAASRPPYSSTTTDWLPSSSQERELEAGNALLSLAANGRQTPSRYIHSLTGNSSQQRFITSDDPLSENLSLLEPGYVEASPSVDTDEASSARMNNFPTPASAEELSSGSVILGPLLKQEQTGENRQRSDELDSNMFFLPYSDHPLQNVASFRVESQSVVEPTSERTVADGNRYPDIWFNPSTDWEVQSSSSESLFANGQNSARVNHELDHAAICLPSTNTESGCPADVLMQEEECGLDLRLGIRVSSQEHDASGSNPREHSYALPVSSVSNEILSTSLENLSSGSERMDILVQSDITGSPVSSSTIFLAENTSNWMAAPSHTAVNLAASTDDDQCLNPTSPSSYEMSSMFINSHEIVNDEERTAHAQRTDSSSARCRLFLPVCSRSSKSASSTVVEKTAITASSGAMFASISSRRSRRQEHLTRRNELRRLRHSQVNGSDRPFGHTACNCLNSDMPPLGCPVCNSLNTPQIFDLHERHPVSSQVQINVSSEHPRSISSSRNEVTPFSNVFHMTESMPVTSDNHLPVSETLRDLDSLQQELSTLGDSEPFHRRRSAAGYSSGPSPRLFHMSNSSMSLDGSTRPSHVIPRIEIYSDELDGSVRSSDEQISQIQQHLNNGLHYLEPGIYRPSSHLNNLHFTSISERLRERQERINFHVEELRSRFGVGSSSSTRMSGLGDGSNDRMRISGPLDDYLFSFHRNLPGFGSGADAAGETLGNEDRTRIVNRLRGFREEIRALRLEMFRNNHRDQDRMSQSGYRHYMPLQQFHNNQDALLSGDMDGQRVRVHAALNRAISGALAANGESSVGNNVVDQTYRIQAWDFIKCQIPDLTNSDSNILVKRAKIHNDANVDISQDGRFLCTFTQPSHNFSVDVMLNVFSLMPENLGECLFTKSFGPNAISVSISPCNHYILVGLATKRFTWMFTPKQMVAQVYQLKTAQAEEDSMEHVCDITHPCDMDFRAPISMNSAKWLPGPGEGLAYGTNRGDLNIYRPGFEQSEKPEVNDNFSDTNPIRRNLMQMLGLTVPRMMSTATQTSLNLRRSASTQTEQNSHSASTFAGAALDQNHASNIDTEDLNLF